MTITSGTVVASHAKATYQYGTKVTVTSTPGAGSKLVGWGGGMSGWNNPTVQL